MDLRDNSSPPPSSFGPDQKKERPVMRRANVKGEGKDRTNRIASEAAAGMTVGGFFVELFKIIVLSLIIIIPVRYFLVQPFFVKGDSMEPSFSNGEYLLIDEISYRFREPARGDVIIFKAPHTTGTYYIKRIIGLPGEEVKVDDGNVVVVNDDFPRGVELAEDYLPASLKTPGSMTMTLGDEEYFVLGDNRGQSSDSRVLGGIPEGDVIGRAWVRGWPISSAGAIHLPDYAFLGNY